MGKVKEKILDILQRIHFTKGYIKNDYFTGY